VANFPTFEENANRPRQAIEIDPPEFDANADGEKTAQEVFIEQQWRDVAANGLASTHPLSINRDSDLITSDPYGA